MAKKAKFKLGSEVRALARKTKVPASKVVPDKKRESRSICPNCLLASCDWSSCEEFFG